MTVTDKISILADTTGVPDLATSGTDLTTAGYPQTRMSAVPQFYCLSLVSIK
jgi:hypothetical protein